MGRHVFPPEKFRLVRDGLMAVGVVTERDVLIAAPAPRADLLLVHTPEYLDDLDQLRWTPRTRMSELPLTVEIVRAYVVAAGGTTRAAPEALTDGFGVHIGGGLHHPHAGRGSAVS